MSLALGLVMLEEPLLHDHVVHGFLDPSDLTMGDLANAGMATPPWWGDGGELAPEVGLLTRNIVIQGEVIGSTTVEYLLRLFPLLPVNGNFFSSNARGRVPIK